MKNRIINILLGYVFPFLLALTLFLLDKIRVNGLTKHWCWIDSSTSMKIIVLYYILIWIFMILSYYFMRKLSNFLKNYLNDNTTNKFTSKLKYITLIQFFSILFATIGKLVIHFFPNRTPIIINDILVYAVVVTLNLQGFLYAIVFGLNPILIEKLNNFHKKLFCLKKEESITDSIMVRDSDN